MLTGTAGLLAGCGARTGGSADRGQLVRSAVGRAVPDPAAATAAAGSLRAFTADLYRQVATRDGNIGCSPYSVAVALAMARNGARGRTAQEMDRVLHASGLPQLNDGLNAVEAALEERSGPVRRGDGSKATIELRVANSLWGQRGVTWQPPFLDALARLYGTGLRVVDYQADADGARVRINAWTSDQTAGKIPHLLPEGMLDELTRLVLVNALYLKAPWEHPFEKENTAAGPFTPADGSTVTVPTMRTQLHAARYASGDGWTAAELPYAGGALAMTLIRPDAGLPALENRLDGPGLARIDRALAPVPELDLRIPKWTFRTTLRLDETLAALGMPAAFDDRAADFGGMTTDMPLHISAVQHETYVAVDEAGTEAAAATAAVVSATSAGPVPVELVLDRPFLFLIQDRATGTPLFLGRVADPST
ncbi:MAG TPA: serpin family protein [Mycobacteriales bacterium]